MTPDPEPAFAVHIGVRDTVNCSEISVALDCHGFIRMRCSGPDDTGSGRECETELTRDEAHVLAHALHDACTWPDTTEPESQAP